MVILRPTHKLRRLLPISSAAGTSSDTALGDWYVNRVVVERRPLLLLVNTKSLLAVITPARDVRGLPDRLSDLVGHRLARLGIRAPVIDAEVDCMTEVVVGKTTDRSVLGIMVNYADMLWYQLDPGFSESKDLREAEELLWENPCYAGKSDDQVIWPRRKTAELLEEKWAAV